MSIRQCAAIRLRKLTITIIFFCCFTLPAQAEGYSASFKNTDITEFINIVSKNLSKTIIVDPQVRGQISVKSYEQLDNYQYYQFFLSVLEVYGFAVIDMGNDMIKVIPSKNVKGAAIPLLNADSTQPGDQIIMQVVKLQHIPARDLAPLLRQLNDAAAGSVVHYDPSNVLLMTGRAAVIEQLLAIVRRVDLREDHEVERINLVHASAVQLADVLTQLIQRTPRQSTEERIVTAVADTRTNSILIAGPRQQRQKMVTVARELDAQQARRGNARVVYLQHAKAENLITVLTGMTGASATPATPAGVSGLSTQRDISITADKQTNALLINAPPDVMQEMEQVIRQLDISRPQVLVEAIIAEVQDAEGLALGVQWFNTQAGGTNFSGIGARPQNWVEGTIAQALGNVNGVTAGFYRGNWAGLFSALENSTRSNILATPSIVTLDNMEAEFNVGKEVPVLTGSQTTNTDRIFNTVDRKSVGTRLKVKPQINQGDVVLLEIEQEVSSVDENGEKNELGPVFNTRTVKNAVLVASGKTVVIGGLLDNSRSKVRSSVPILGSLPLIGGLFRYQSEQQGKRNLMLFIRPTVLRQEDSYQQVTQQQQQRFTQQLNNQPPELELARSMESLFQSPATSMSAGQALQQTESALAAFAQGLRE